MLPSRLQRLDRRSAAPRRYQKELGALSEIVGNIRDGTSKGRNGQSIDGQNDISRKQGASRMSMVVVVEKWRQHGKVTLP